MKLPIYQIDAFSKNIFAGNPAAICPLEEWLAEDVMQKIAIENNLAETAFFVRNEDGSYHLRWFTPEFEIDLCGHATLASAFVLFEHLGVAQNKISFQSASGPLEVAKGEQGLLQLDFPSRKPEAINMLQVLLEAFSIHPKEVLKSRDFFLVFENQQEIEQLKIAASLLSADQFDRGGIICTAPGDEVDFVSRFFLPGSPVFEDPVTGSAHCSLIPYWSEKLGKKKMRAKQLSQRSGDIFCEDHGDRVKIAGHAVTYLKGEIEI